MPIRKISIYGKEMDYLCFGKGRDSLLIIPGMSPKSVYPFASGIAKQYEAFAEDYTVYLAEAPMDMDDGYDVHSFAEYLNSFLEELGIAKATLFGVSYGGMAALDIAYHHPDRVDRMALVSTCAKPDEEARAKFAMLKEYALSHDTERMVEHFVDMVYTPEYKEKNLQLLVDYYRDLSFSQYERFATMCQAVLDFDLEDRLIEIGKEAFVFGSRQDNTFSCDRQADMGRRLGAFCRFDSGYSHAIYDECAGFQQMVHDCLKGAL